MKTYIILVLFIIISCKNSREAKQKGASEASSDTVIFTGKVQKLAGGFGFTEGPAVDSLGNVYFTDIPNNKILIWKIEGKLDTFQPKSGNANGLYFDTMGNLIACEGGEGRIAAYEPDGEHSVLADNFKGKGSINPMTFGRISKVVSILPIPNMPARIPIYLKMENTFII